DEMVRIELLAETATPNQVGVQYAYELSELAKKRVGEFEATLQGKEAAAGIAPFEACAKRLLESDIWTLEISATLVCFRRQGYDWNESIERTCLFKKIDPASCKSLKRIEDLAREFIRE